MKKSTSNLLRTLFPITGQIVNDQGQVKPTLEQLGSAMEALLGKSARTAGNWDGPNLRLALVVGHNLIRQGAVATGPVAITEFLFNTALAQEIAFHAWRGLQVETFFRRGGSPFGYRAEIEECYRRVNAWQPDLAIELHFNAGDGHADYSLVLHRDGRTMESARVLSTAFSEILGTSKPQVRQFKSDTERGALGGVFCRSPWLLAEPFFGDHKPTMERIYREGNGSLVMTAYLQGIHRIAERLRWSDGVME